MASFQLIIGAFGLQGLKPVIYGAQLGQQRPAEAANDYPDQSPVDNDNITGEGADAQPTTWLGTPVFADLRFPRDGKSDIKLETVLIDVSQRKNIVTTAVQGRNGTVKEYVSDGDFEVRLRGAIVKEGRNSYPTAEVRDLQELLSRPETVKIVADYLRLFNIYSGVITGYSFPQQEGFQNVQLFEINLISDTPEELIEEENATPDQ